MTLVRYVYLRALEIEGRHPNDAGCWTNTVRRLEFGEGLPPEDELGPQVDVARNAPLPPSPKLATSVLRRGRSICYKRLRSVAECEDYLAHRYPVVFALDLFPGWGSPRDGRIPMPAPGESALADSHAVSVVDYQPELREFLFVNSWGEKWGNRGTGYLPYEYFDRFVFECLVPCRKVRRESTRATRIPQGQEIRWVIRDEGDRRIYGYEICSRGPVDARMLFERWAWAFVIERDGTLEVEDLYVRPEFRGRGYASRLSERIVELARAKREPLRVWVSFADCRQESPQTYSALVPIAKRLGVQFHPCPVRWAAYFATNEQPGSASPVEPPRIPARPRGTLGDVLAAAALMGGALSVPQTPGVQARVVASHREEIAEVGGDLARHPEIGTTAWNSMNVRRAELIRKKNFEELNAEEQLEYERLQAISLVVLERSFPRPPLDWARLEELERKATADREGRDDT